MYVHTIIYSNMKYIFIYIFLLLEPTQLHKSLKSRTSWSSIETTDSSSGIGSHNSLNSHHMRSGHSSTSTLPNNSYCHSNSSNESEGIEPDFPDCDIGNYPPPPMDMNMPMKYGGPNSDVSMKYATIDRSHFRRNQRMGAALRDQNMEGVGNNKQRSNSFGETEPNLPDYKMNLPKNKMNTICARTAFPNASGPGGRPSIYTLFDQQCADLRRQLSPTSSPVKTKPPPPLPRRNSNGPPPVTAPKPKGSPHKQMSLPHPVTGARAEPKAFTENNEPEHVTPGSFQDALNKRRLTMRKMSQTESSSHV